VAEQDHHGLAVLLLLRHRCGGLAGVSREAGRAGGVAPLGRCPSQTPPCPPPHTFRKPPGRARWTAGRPWPPQPCLQQRERSAGGEGAARLRGPSRLRQSVAGWRRCSTSRRGERERPPDRTRLRRTAAERRRGSTSSAVPVPESFRQYAADSKCLPASQGLHTASQRPCVSRRACCALVELLLARSKLLKG